MPLEQHVKELAPSTVADLLGGEVGHTRISGSHVEHGTVSYRWRQNAKLAICDRQATALRSLELSEVAGLSAVGL
jgi:hypothetical protein